jgi:hypothetical protein
MLCCYDCVRVVKSKKLTCSLGYPHRLLGILLKIHHIEERDGAEKAIIKCIIEKANV